MRSVHTVLGCTSYVRVFLPSAVLIRSSKTVKQKKSSGDSLCGRRLISSMRGLAASRFVKKMSALKISPIEIKPSSLG